MGLDDFIDLYEVLEVPPSSTTEEIRDAHRRLIRKHHPDVGGDEARARALNFARDVLVHRDRRRDYDKRRSTYLAMHARGPSRVRVTSPITVAAPRATGVASEFLADDIKEELRSGSWLSALALAFLGHRIDKAIGDATARNPVAQAAVDALADWMRAERIEDERDARRARVDARLKTRLARRNERVDSVRAAKRRPPRKRRDR